MPPFCNSSKLSAQKINKKSRSDRKIIFHPQAVWEVPSKFPAAPRCKMQGYTDSVFAGLHRIWNWSGTKNNQVPGGSIGFHSMYINIRVSTPHTDRWVSQSDGFPPGWNSTFCGLQEIFYSTIFHLLEHPPSYLVVSAVSAQVFSPNKIRSKWGSSFLFSLVSEMPLNTNSFRFLWFLALGYPKKMMIDHHAHVQTAIWINLMNIAKKHQSDPNAVLLL